MALTNATTLADYGAGIGTQGATLKVDATNKRVGVGTDSPAGPEGSLQVGTGITFFGNTGIVSAIGGKFSGDFTVGGTLTYEDVANIDAVGIITAQSHVSIADSILHTGDTDTSIRFPSAGTFTIETNGSERFKVTDSLKEIKNGSLRITSTFIQFSGDVSTPSAAAALYRPADNEFAISTSNNERLRIDSSGNIGIGTDNPGSRLDVRNASGTDPLVSLHHSNADVQGEVIRIGRVDLPAIRYHSIKARHGGGASSNHITFNLHDGSSITSQSEILRLRGDGNVGIGTDDPSRLLELAQSNSTAYSTTDFDQDYHVLRLRNYTSDKSVGMQFLLGNNGEAAITAHEEDADGDTTLAFGVRNSGSRAERLRIDSGGRLLVGSTSAETSFRTPKVQIKGTDNNTGILIHNTNSNADGGSLNFAHSRGTGVISSGDIIGDVTWCANDGTDIATRAALIRGSVDGAPGSNDMPGRLQFYTTPDGSENPSERMRIHNGGTVTIPNGITLGTTITSTNAANTLHDYEEGTFTATCSNSVTLHSNTNLIQYVKIGASVTVMGQIRVNSGNSGSSLTINNLPFTVSSSGEGSGFGIGAVRLYSADMASDHKYIVALADSGSTNLQFQGVRDNATSQGLGATDDGYYMFTVTYRTVD